MLDLLLVGIKNNITNVSRNGGKEVKEKKKNQCTKRAFKISDVQRKKEFVQWLILIGDEKKKDNCKARSENNPECETEMQKTIYSECYLLSRCAQAASNQ